MPSESRTEWAATRMSSVASSLSRPRMSCTAPITVSSSSTLISMSARRTCTSITMRASCRPRSETSSSPSPSRESVDTYSWKASTRSAIRALLSPFQREEQEERPLLGVQVVVGDEVAEGVLVVPVAVDPLEVVEGEGGLDVRDEPASEDRLRAERFAVDLAEAHAHDPPVRVVGPLEHEEVAPGEEGGVGGPQRALEAIAQGAPVGGSSHPAPYEVALDPVLGHREEPALAQREERLDPPVEGSLGEVGGGGDGVRGSLEPSVVARVVPDPVLALEAH